MTTDLVSRLRWEANECEVAVCAEAAKYIEDLEEYIHQQDLKMARVVSAARDLRAADSFFINAMRAENRKLLEELMELRYRIESLEK